MAQKELGTENVNIQIISQDLEGKLGFMTAVALTPELTADQIVSWDSGNASFQLVAKNSLNAAEYILCKGNMGNAPTAKLFVEKIRKKQYHTNTAINPVTPAEIQEFIALLAETVTLPADFTQQIQTNNMRVIGIGGPTSIFSVASKALGKTTFTKEELHTALYAYAHKENSDPALQLLDPVEPQSVLTRLMLMYAIMEKLALTSITYKSANGNTLGIMLSPEFWK